IAKAETKTAVDAEMLTEEEDAALIAENDQSNLFLTAIEKLAASPEKVHAQVATMRSNYRATHPCADEKTIHDALAKDIIRKQVWLATASGGATGVVSVIPGIGTLLAALGGGLTDVAICMKIQVDMCLYLAEIYGYDVTEVDGRNLAFLIAGLGSLEKAGAPFAAKLGGNAGVKMVRQYLKGAVLQTIKEVFKRVGLTFTRKAVEKILPFGISIFVGGGANYLLTRYVACTANKWFRMDFDDRAGIAG
ncbi:MAG: EcsC family protein, partial [Victivallaceae bacterium]|nr:EcsC family protein [Victivallaceae bacterium]